MFCTFKWMCYNVMVVICIHRVVVTCCDGDFGTQTNVVLIIGQRRRRWPNIKTTLVQHSSHLTISVQLSNY